MTAFDKHTTHSNYESVGPRDASEQTSLIPILKAAQGCGIFLDVQSTIAGRAVRVCVDGANWYVTHSTDPS